MKGKLLIVILISCLAYSLWSFLTPVGLEGPTNIKTTGAELIGGHFTLTDHTGRSVSDQNFRGKYMLVFFGFTNCQKVCPLGLHTMGQALNKLGTLSNKIRPIFITVDPERDDVKRLASYLKVYDERLVGLTGSAQEIENVTIAYRAYFRKIALKNKQDYTFDHSAIIYLIDPGGQYVAHFASELGADEIASRIRSSISATQREE